MTYFHFALVCPEEGCLCNFAKKRELFYSIYISLFQNVFPLLRFQQTRKADAAVTFQSET